VVPRRAILKAASLTSLFLMGTPSYATTEDRIAMRIGLVEGRAGTSGFLLTDGACEAGPFGDDSWAQSGLSR
jgi:hypothetical protein